MKILNNLLSRKSIIRFFLILIAISVIMKLFGVGYITDVLVLGLVAHANTMIGLNSWEKLKSKK